MNEKSTDMKHVARILAIFIFPISSLFAQTEAGKGSLLHNATLEECIQYGLEHQPAVQQSLINERIANQEVKVKLADWFPQVNLNFGLQHNYKLPTTIFQGQPVQVGLINTSTGSLSVSQTLFDRDVLLASSTAGDVRRQAEQTTTGNRIDVIVNISKAYFSVLLTQNQIDLAIEDTARLGQSVRDSYNQYKGGIVDKTDYMQATIALNNAKAELRQDQEQLKTSYATLKEQMGYPPNGEIQLNYDMTRMEEEVSFDTTQRLDYQNRIEYQLLQTQRRLQEANLDYYKWSFLPSLSAFGAYNLNYQNNQLSNLYLQDFPSYYVGLQLSFPIFQGGKRIHEIEQAKLELKLIDYDQSGLESSINTDYTQALATYKSNLNNFHVQQDNVTLAKDVYNIIELQYKSGIKTYLDLITAETNLKTTQVNYLNALYQVLTSKLDLQKALGTIHY
jgi:outer membrane protein